MPGRPGLNPVGSRFTDRVSDRSDGCRSFIDAFARVRPPEVTKNILDGHA